MTRDSRDATEATTPHKSQINNLDARVSQEPHIIIGGCGRSGTTLLRVMLDTHPNILCGPETNLFTPYLIDLDWLARAYNVKPKTLAMIERRAKDRVEFVDQFSYASRARAGKMRWAEKTPKNVRDIGWIFEHWPRAKFIHVIRDGRDTVASLKEHPKTSPGIEPMPFPMCVDKWVNDVSAGIRWRGDVRYMEARYECLVTMPRVELLRVFEFIGAGEDTRHNQYLVDQCLEYYKIERDTAFFANNKEAANPITTRRIGRWIKDLNAAELVLFWQTAGDLMRELGYG